MPQGRSCGLPRKLVAVSWHYDPWLGDRDVVEAEHSLPSCSSNEGVDTWSCKPSTAAERDRLLMTQSMHSPADGACFPAQPGTGAMHRDDRRVVAV
jgi:hypothetical protein